MQDDFEALFAAASDPLIWQQHPEPDRYKRAIFRRYFDGAIESKGAFVIIDRASGRIVGSSRYCNVNLDRSELEIGWTFLERACWGGSYNRELKSLMLDHAFQFFDRVFFVVGEGNVRSQKAVQKIGASYLKTVQLPAPDGGLRSNKVFVITRQTYHCSTRNP